MSVTKIANIVEFLLGVYFFNLKKEKNVKQFRSINFSFKYVVQI